MNPFLLVLLFIVSALVGYKIISNVPSLLHTPLMSGMNALSGVTVLGSLVAAALALATASRIIGGIAVILAMINVVGGFLVTHRMLKMFKSRTKE